MKPLIIIPARGGSKGVPGKNIKLLHGKPLIQYTIDEVRRIFSDDVIYVSTDDKEIKKVVENLGLQVPFLRPIELSSDTAGTYEVLLHAIKEYENAGNITDTIILLQPTSPFRTKFHIEEALKLFIKNENCEMVVSVKETNSNPYYVHFEESNDGFLKKLMKKTFTRRQDCPKVYEFNGAIYICKVDSLKKMKMSEFTKIIKYEMDEISSHDIDTLSDWKLAEFFLQ